MTSKRCTHFPPKWPRYNSVKPLRVTRNHDRPNSRHKGIINPGKLLEKSIPTDLHNIRDSSSIKDSLSDSLTRNSQR